jgi:SAM-dependent methyltransferase
MTDAVEARKALQRQRAADLEAKVRRLLGAPGGEGRALDVGCGAGAFAYAVAPHVAEVIGIDGDEALLAAARDGAPPNATFVLGDAAALPFGYGEFDVVGCLRLLHHVRRPELVVAELARVTRPGGRILLVDQRGDIDPMVSLELDRFERSRDPSHTRLLPDADIRGFLDANDLVVVSNEIEHERRDLEQFLDIAGLEGDERERVRRMAPAPVYEIEVGWYVARKRG